MKRQIQDLIERLPLDQPMDAEEYMAIDDNVTAREIPTDGEIVSIVKNCESNESDDGDRAVILCTSHYIC